MKKITIGILAFLSIALVFALWQFTLYNRSNSIVDFLLEAGKSCGSGNSSMCAALPATEKNLESNMSRLISPLANMVGSEGRYSSAISLMRETKKLAAEEIRKNNAEAEDIKNIANAIHQSEMRRSDLKIEEEKEISNMQLEYEQLAKPKIMYACGNKVAYMAAKGFSNYNDLFEKAKSDCSDGWTFKVIRSEK
jgi:hypothetical protein